MIKNFFKKIGFEIKMLCIDASWSMTSRRCWEAYPPSFYYRYTEEERKAIIARDKAELLKLIDELPGKELTSVRK